MIPSKCKGFVSLSRVTPSLLYQKKKQSITYKKKQFRMISKKVVTDAVWCSSRSLCSREDLLLFWGISSSIEALRCIECTWHCTHLKNNSNIHLYLTLAFNPWYYIELIHSQSRKKPADASEVSDVSWSKVLEENAYGFIWEDAESAERLWTPISLLKRRRFVHCCFHAVQFQFSLSLSSRARDDDSPLIKWNAFRTLYAV